MLVLTRKTNEKIIIGDGIQITVLQARGARVKLGFSAPDDVQIHREEVHRRLEQEKSVRRLANALGIAQRPPDGRPAQVARPVKAPLAMTMPPAPEACEA